MTDKTNKETENIANKFIEKCIGLNKIDCKEITLTIKKPLESFQAGIEQGKASRQAEIKKVAKPLIELLERIDRNDWFNADDKELKWRKALNDFKKILEEKKEMTGCGKVVDWSNPIDGYLEIPCGEVYLDDLVLCADCKRKQQILEEK